MPYHFDSGQWEHEPDVIFECQPAPAGKTRIIYTGGLVGIRKLNGNIVTSTAYLSVGDVYIEEGETLILFSQNEFPLSYHQEFIIDGEEKSVFDLWLDMQCFVSKMSICDRKIIRKQRHVFRDELNAMILEDRDIYYEIQWIISNHGKTIDEGSLQQELSTYLLRNYGLKIEGLSLRTIIRNQNRPFEIKPGSLIDGQFLVKDLLDDSGACGDVWLVEWKNMHAPLVMKCVKDKDHKRFIEYEIENLRWVVNNLPNHPNLAHFQWVITEPELLLFYQYIDGQTLDKYWKDHQDKHNSKGITHIIEQVLSGLAELHEIELIHRDLHPRNIMIDHKGKVYILDLGLAVREGAVYQNEIMNSLRNIKLDHPWAEPNESSEILFDKKTDLYSVGKLMWWMITGIKNLTQGSPLEEDFPEWATAFLPIIKKACVAPRAERYNTSAEMHQAILKVFEAPLLIQEKQKVDDAPLMIKAHEKGVFSITFDSKGKYFASGGRDGQISIWDSSSLQKVKSIPQELNETLALAYGDSGELWTLERAGSAHVLRKINIEHGSADVIGRFELLSTMAMIAPWAGIVVIGSYQGQVQAINLNNGKENPKSSFRSTQENESINSLSVSPSGKHIGAGTNRGNFLLFNCEDKKLQTHHWTGKSAINAICFNYSDSEAALGGQIPAIGIINLVSMIEKRHIEVGPTHGIASHPTEDLYAIGRYDGKVSLCGRRMVREPFGDHTSQVWEVKFSPDGSMLVFGGIKDGCISVLKLRN